MLSQDVLGSELGFRAEFVLYILPGEVKNKTKQKLARVSLLWIWTLLSASGPFLGSPSSLRKWGGVIFHLLLNLKPSPLDIHVMLALESYWMEALPG